jgi:hypothetical protein
MKGAPESMSQKNPFRWRSTALLLVLATLAGASGARAACDGKEVLFADDFSNPDLSWGPRDVTVFRNGKYAVAIEPNGTVRDWPSAHLFSENYSVCVKMKLPNDPAGEAGSGIAFWIDPAKNQIGSNDYYLAVASPDGYYWVSRFVNGTRSSVMADAHEPIVKTGPNDVNELSVTLQGNAGTFSINGQEVGKFSGQPPKQAYAGITAGAPLEKKYVVEFFNFRVLRP